MEEPARGQREWRGCLSAQSLSFDGTVYSLEGTESEGSLVACRADSNPFDFYGSKPQFTLIDVLVGERETDRTTTSERACGLSRSFCTHSMHSPAPGLWF